MRSSVILSLITFLLLQVVSCAQNAPTSAGSAASVAPVKVADACNAPANSPALAGSQNLLAGINLDDELGFVAKSKIDASTLRVTTPTFEIFDFGGYKKLAISFDDAQKIDKNYTMDSKGHYKICATNDSTIPCIEDYTGFPAQTFVTLDPAMKGNLNVAVSGCVEDHRKLTDANCGIESTGIILLDQGDNQALYQAMVGEDGINQQINQQITILQQAATDYMNSVHTTLTDSQTDDTAKALQQVAKVLIAYPTGVQGLLTTEQGAQGIQNYQTQQNNLVTQLQQQTKLELAGCPQKAGLYDSDSKNSYWEGFGTAGLIVGGGSFGSCCK